MSGGWPICGRSIGEVGTKVMDLLKVSMLTLMIMKQTFG
jgi:hypothetical protein